MKRSLCFLLGIFLSQLVQAQQVEGDWYGLLNVGAGTQMEIVFHIKKTDKGYSSLMDSPDQKAKDIPVANTSFENNLLKLDMSNFKIEYSGKLIENSKIVGTFTQNGKSIPMNLTHDRQKKKSASRPQNPTEPYPYVSEKVNIPNPATNGKLAGILTLPSKEGSFPVVVLISGSGPQNHDEEIMGHKPFLVLSDFLTRQGFAVLRYDDRGVAGSDGDFAKATSRDFANDVKTVVAYLKTRKDINAKKIGLLGHSEGGAIAPLIASELKDIAFLVLMAGTGISGGDLLLAQQQEVGKVYGQSADDLKHTKEFFTGAFAIITEKLYPESKKTKLTAYVKQAIKTNPKFAIPKDMTETDFVNSQVNQLLTPWMEYFINYNPATALQKVTCPVLALNGDKDVQVPADMNLSAIEAALKKAGNTQYVVKKMANMNHLFQECKTGSPEEYEATAQTISPLALDEIGNWLKALK